MAFEENDIVANETELEDNTPSYDDLLFAFKELQDEMKIK